MSTLYKNGFSAKSGVGYRCSTPHKVLIGKINGKLTLDQKTFEKVEKICRLDQNDSIVSNCWSVNRKSQNLGDND
jgi:hypothetical protein